MPRPRLLTSRPPAARFALAVVLPGAFGALTGLMLGLHEIAYLILAVPVGLAGGYFAGLEHEGGMAGAARGALGGLMFGGLLVAVHTLSGWEPKAAIPEPAVLLVVITSTVGTALGALGGRTRARHSLGRPVSDRP